MQQTIMKNPYDLDRNYFVLKVRQSIPYFKDVSEENLKKIFFDSETKIYEMEQHVFKRNQRCEFILIVMQGVLAIELETCSEHVTQLDLLGRGSVIGSHSILSGAKWNYRCVCRS